MGGLQGSHLYEVGTGVPVIDDVGGLQVRAIEPEGFLRFGGFDGQAAPCQREADHAQDRDVCGYFGQKS